MVGFFKKYRQMKKSITLLASLFIFSLNIAQAQHSIARQWNEKVLDAIRGDFARPTVHARNLFHTSMAMYDAWAAYDTLADTYLLGKTVHGYTCPFDGVPVPTDVEAARREAISFGVYRLLRHRFLTSPSAFELFTDIDFFMASLGYDTDNTSVDYPSGDPAALGNYIAQQIINYGLQDGSNEQFGYQNLYYEPVNPPLIMAQPGNPDIIDMNRWQPLTLDIFIDQSGNPIPFNTPDFLSPEWGQVTPFSLKEEEATTYTRDFFDYIVYHDPGPPAYLDTTMTGGVSEEYKWGYTLVAVWSSHLHPSDSVMWDISPGSIGNIDVSQYPTDIAGLRNFYNLMEGGDPGLGHDLNPATGQPYEPQIVPRADYARVLAEFWADGPDSETPPGHWFTILNYVNDNPLLVKKFGGQGPVLNNLEWDVKSYLMLGGGMHDVAIASWGIKGWYDYIRPVSAIRGMAEFGQSSDPNLPSYHPGGIHLVPGVVEVVMPGDPLQGASGEHVGKIKLKAWRGPDYIADPLTDDAGVGWILAENWWPYQRPSFVTPPFAGYVSGHSTYSRAAAEILTALTGDPFFPGGMGEFHCPKNEFLVFEDGPSVDLTLQWATYRDASDQCSLSRIWGGIHPPVDDMPGRLIGIKIGLEAFDKAEKIFYKDHDNDGFLNSVDCNDYNPAIYPGAVEICDEADNNCDGEIDEGFPLNTYFLDFDNDGYGDINAQFFTCLNSPPTGYVTQPGDCDDTNPDINPDMAEMCDGLDNDCNGLVDDALTTYTYYFDADGDGFGNAAFSLDTCLATPVPGYADNAMDCDDTNPAINPDMAEMCDGIDNDCNGLVDDGLTVFTYYKDNDGDLFGDPAISLDTCGALDPNLGFVLNGFDCDDSNPDINPLASEIADSLDNDCNGLVDDGVTSVNESAQNPVRLFPNPTNGLMTVEYGFAETLSISIFYPDGRKALARKVDFTNGFAQLDLMDLLPGIYYLMATDQNSTRHFVKKIVRM
ncbi:MAG TPA: T9SS type A sorting domain-containing protein [Bacteroidetes bacterium]|nr:T9SS type A sorting domain-containing protein [Bacteroidota bacterium]